MTAADQEPESPPEPSTDDPGEGFDTEVETYDDDPGEGFGTERIIKAPSEQE